LEGTAPARTVSAGSSAGVVSVTRTPGLSVVKSATPTTVSRAGDRVSYSFVVTNTGNVTMSDIRVQDVLSAPAGPALTVTCPTQSLVPDGTLTCTADQYVVTQADIKHGSITSTTTVSGQASTPADGVVPSRTVTESPSISSAIVKVVAATKPAAGGLARAGVNPLVPFGGAGVLVLLGGMVLLIARRRQAANG